MCACDFDMMFTFVYTGWEGTANDSRVFADAVTRPENKFPFPNEGIKLPHFLLYMFKIESILYFDSDMQKIMQKKKNRILLCCGCWIYKHARILSTLSR